MPALLLTALPLSSMIEGSSSTFATALLPDTSESCPLGRFYAYQDKSEDFGHLWPYMCAGLADVCQARFQRRMLQHPCRTSTLTVNTPVLVLNPLHRATTWSPIFTDGYRSSLGVLQRLPADVKHHPHVYLLQGAEQENGRGLDLYRPPGSVTFVSGDSSWSYHISRSYVEPKVPNSYDACYLYTPHDNVVALPWFKPHNETAAVLRTARRVTARPYKVFYYAGIHGRASALRRRLYELCKSQPDWVCPRTRLEFKQGLHLMERSTFCLSPTGDSPGRDTTWDALSRGCVPVHFSSCPMTTVLQQHAHLIPADPLETFGVREWSVLANQTAVMTSDAYLHSLIKSISVDQIRSMRAPITDKVVNRFTVADEESHDDLVAFVVDHMLRHGRGLPKAGPNIPEDFVQYYPWYDRPTDVRSLTDPLQAARRRRHRWHHRTTNKSSWLGLRKSVSVSVQ